MGILYEQEMIFRYGICTVIEMILFIEKNGVFLKKGMQMGVPAFTCHQKNPVVNWVCGKTETRNCQKMAENEIRRHEMKYKCMIFDLDGTLVNSIHALTYCTNLALERFGLGPLTEEQMKTIVGDGYRMQMRRSLLACGDTQLTHYEAILPVYMEIFGKHCNYQMHAYEGIQELLEYGRRKNMGLAVVSNKPWAQAVDTVEYVFGKGCFDVVIGEREGIPKKPDPTGALTAARELQASPEECLYFGDTNTDMQTGKNAGMTTVGVLWGFRGREELAAFHPRFLLERPQEMIEKLEEMN